MTTQSPPSAEPEAVREHIATSIPRAEMKLDEAAYEHALYREIHRSHGRDTWATLKDAARELVAVEQHEQRERAREGMDEATGRMLGLAANICADRDPAAVDQHWDAGQAKKAAREFAAGLLAANERIAALEAEVGRVSAERDAEYQDAIRAERAQDRLEISLDVLRSRLAGLLWRVKRERDEARKVAADRKMWRDLMHAGSRTYGNEAAVITPQECPVRHMPGHGLDCSHCRGSEVHLLDNCRMCLGAKGNVLGNENVIGGIVCCDDCSVLMRDSARAEVEALRGALKTALSAYDFAASMLRIGGHTFEDGPALEPVRTLATKGTP